MMSGEMRRISKEITVGLTLKACLPVLVAATSLTGCVGTQEKSIPDADWVSDQPLYDGDKKSLFLNSEFRDKKKKGDKEPTKEDYVALGDEAWQSGDAEKATYDYLRALKLDDQDKTLYFKIGIIHEQGGNVELADLAFRKAIELDPTYVPALERRGTMLLKQRKYEEAKSAFREVIALDHVRLKKLALERSAGAATEAVAGDDAGDQPAAMSMATDLGDIVVPQFDQYSPFHAYNGLGVIEDLDGNHHAALKAFDIARQISPRSPFIYNNMGYSSYLANDLAQAESLFRQAVAMDREYVAAWRNLALVHIRREQFDEAIAVLTVSVDDEASANNTVGYLCMLGKKYDLAERYFDRAIELSPTFFAAANENLKKNSQLRSKERVAMQLP